MGEYLSPGVYVEELDNSPRTIEGMEQVQQDLLVLQRKDLLQVLQH